MSITTSADRRRSERSSPSPSHTACSRCDTREPGLVGGGVDELGKAAGPLRRLHPSYLAEMEDFPPEHRILALILLRWRRPKAKYDFGILHLPTCGPPHLASILTSVFSEQLHSRERAAPRTHGLFRSPWHGNRVLIVDPIDPPQNCNRIVRSQRRQIRVEGRDANASQI